MHLCVRGDPFTSVPTTIFQLDFVTFSAILHSLFFFREVFFYSRIFTDNGQSYTNGSNSHENKNISRNQFCLFCFCFCVTCSIILHSLLLFCFVFVLVKFFSIRVSLQTMDKVIRMVPIVPIKLYSHENNKNIPRNQFCLFCFCFDKCSLLVLHYNFKSLKSR